MTPSFTLSISNGFDITDGTVVISFFTSSSSLLNPASLCAGLLSELQIPHTSFVAVVIAVLSWAVRNHLSNAPSHLHVVQFFQILHLFFVLLDAARRAMIPVAEAFRNVSFLST